jgi:hypothetical protein
MGFFAQNSRSILCQRFIFISTQSIIKVRIKLKIESLKMKKSLAIYKVQWLYSLESN